jgi:hypothetical protein
LDLPTLPSDLRAGVAAMTAEGWRSLVFQAIDRHDRHGDPEPLNLLVQLLVEQDQAKQALREIGFGCTGMPWAEVVREIVTLTTAPTRDS